MPVGFHALMKLIGILTLQLEKRELLCLTIDGFSDQFVGLDGKKIICNRFKELLIKLFSLQLHEHQDFLKQHLNEWKGNQAQTYDIMVLCWKVD